MVSLQDPLIQGKIIDLLAALILLSTLVLVSRKRLRACIRTYAFQSFLLALLTFLVALSTGTRHLYYSAALTLIVKVLLIPNIFLGVVNRLQIKREVETTISIPSSLLIASGLTIVAYTVSAPLVGMGRLLTDACLPISISMILLGLFIMVTRRAAAMQVIGLVTMENGIFLSAISITYGMPLIVELGIFFDILVGVMIMGIFATAMTSGLNKTIPPEKS